SACLGCHTIQGVSPGIIGPNLTHVGGRTTIASGLFPNDPTHLASWIADAPALKPGALMTRMKPPLKDDDIAALVAYLESLKWATPRGGASPAGSRPPTTSGSAGCT